MVTRATHPVETDPDAVRAWFARRIAETEAAETVAARADERAADELAAVDSDPASWKKAADLAAMMLAGFAPAWEVTTDERAEISGAVADCLDHYFPGATAGVDHWHPLLRLTWVLGAVAVMRIEPYERAAGGIGLRIQPMRQGKATDGDSNNETAGRGSDSDSGGDRIGENVGRFASDGE